VSLVRRWQRRPPEVDAALVTEDNADQVAAWCGGSVREEDGQTVVHLPQSVVPARVGDYVARSVLPGGLGPPYTVRAEVHEWAFRPAVSS
jgi:hypothetical protein